jgi:hypothetical protein
MMTATRSGPPIFVANILLAKQDGVTRRIIAAAADPISFSATLYTANRKRFQPMITGCIVLCCASVS